MRRNWIALAMFCALAACEVYTERDEGPPVVKERSWQSRSMREPSKQQRAVEAYGLTDYRDTGPAIIGCSESDSFLNSNTFEAKTQHGSTVTGTVCCGWLKDCTVRTQ